VRGVRVMSSGRWHPPLGLPPLTARRAPRLIAIGAALPGAGKSVIASNLAVAMAGMGRQVVVADLDARAPRQHLLFGVAPPECEAARETGVRNVRLWAGSNRMTRALDPGVRREILLELAELDADVVIVDVGTDSRDDLWNFFAAGAARLLVSTRDQPALEATYAFLKGAVLRAERLYGAGAREVLAQFSGGLVGNATGAPEDAETFHAFSRIVREELGIPLSTLGCLRRNPRIVQSIAAGKPLLARRGLDDEVRAFHQMAESILTDAASSVGDCALDGAATEIASGPLPVDLASYVRKHPRFPVDWAASLALPGGTTEVRVLDVSEAGAAIETTLSLRAGDTAVLHLDQIEGQPALAVVVKNVVPRLGRVGLAFAEGDAKVLRILVAERARRVAP
jgi:MinD-like ATPase involved in chromosome partitioning or flagellar assembly